MSTDPRVAYDDGLAEATRNAEALVTEEIEAKVKLRDALAGLLWVALRNGVTEDDPHVIAARDALGRVSS